MAETIEIEIEIVAETAETDIEKEVKEAMSAEDREIVIIMTTIAMTSIVDHLNGLRNLKFLINHPLSNTTKKCLQTFSLR